MKQSITLNLHRVDNKKTKAKSTLIVDLLKNHGIPGGQAVKIFQTNRPEYIVRKCFLLDYQLEKRNPITIVDAKRWIQSAIRNDYLEPEAFNNWYKDKCEYIIKNGNDDLKRLVEI
jgi:hypothetical protein